MEFQTGGDAGYFLASPALFYFANRAAINTASKFRFKTMY
jgi:hypothetical protein